MISFFEPCIPPKTSHHSKRIVNIRGVSRLADTPELEAAKFFWDSIFILHKPIEPMKGILFAKIVLTWPWNSRDGALRRKRYCEVPHAAKPDCDNIAKTVIDSAVRCGLILQDSHITELLVSKWRGSNPGIEFYLNEIASETK